MDVLIEKHHNGLTKNLFAITLEVKNHYLKPKTIKKYPLNAKTGNA